jgi:phospholipid/cholesterol/gamma-HCH transport system substrate-binding protein
MTTNWRPLRLQLVGIVFLVIIALLVWLSIAVYDKAFTPVSMVSLTTSSAGNELHVHADVKVRGVIVGEVRSISSTGDGAVLTLALQPDKVRLLPANVSAELLPTTLFGERYVDLVLPADPAPARLTNGSAIAEDRTGSAIELDKLLDDLLPTLEAVQPQKLSVTLTAVSQALDDRGAELGRTLAQLGDYLGKLDPQLPALDKDITNLVKVADEYDRATPDIISAFHDLTTTANTVVAQQHQLLDLYSTVTTAAGTVTDFLRDNQNTLIRLNADSRHTLALLARYSSEFPCTLQALVAFEPAVDKVLGKGTHQPGLHITAKVLPSKGPYLPGKDTPVYGDALGPHCYPIGRPFPGITLHDGTTSTPLAHDSHGNLVAQPAAAVNSASENELITELASSSVGTPAAGLPNWTSVLLGPIYRGTEVTVK